MAATKKSRTRSPRLTHLLPDGSAHMVDVTGKDHTARVAVADGSVRMSKAAFAAMAAGQLKKGDALGVARIAGIQGAKKTWELIPLCHPIPITGVEVDVRPDPDLPGVHICATVKTQGQTGVEMEALTAVGCAALAVYDMIKAVDRGMVIGEMSVRLKDGGRSGRYQRPTEKQG